jgi:hypothetical protein
MVDFGIKIVSGFWGHDREQVAFGEYPLGDEDGVEGFGKSAIDRGVSEGLDNFARRQADVECGVEVNLELRFAAAQCGKDAQGDELPLRRREAGAGVDIAEAEGNDVPGQGRRNVGQRIHDALAARSVDGRQYLCASFVAGSVDLGSERAGPIGGLSGDHGQSVLACSQEPGLR